MTPPADFFQLRDHQERAFDATREAFRRHRRVVVQLPTGAGKTRLAVSMMHAAMERGKRSLFICDRVELIDQTSEALDAFDMDHGVIQADHWRIKPNLPIQVASPQTLARRSWPNVDFVIVDECFVAGTTVATPDGDRNIEDIKEGDVVCNAAGTGRVRKLICNTAEALYEIKVSNNARIRCTPNHKVFTGRGWVKAEELEVGDRLFGQQDLSGLWRRVQPSDINQKQQPLHQHLKATMGGAAYLLQELCKNTEQPYAEHRDQEEGKQNIQGQGDQAGAARWERKAGANPATSASYGFRGWMDIGIRPADKGEGVERESPAEPLQDRHRKPGEDDRYRGGWGVALHDCQTGAGQAQDGSAALTRVVGVSRIECGSGVPVYNLHVSGHHTYFAEGVCVSNCHTQYQATLKQMQAWNKIPWLGLSATPFARGMGLHWETLVVGATAAELIQAGVLVNYKAYGPSSPDLSGVHMKGEDYDQKELGEAVTKKRIVGDIVKTWKELGENRQTLCFAVNIAHAKAIAAAFNSSGIPAAHLDHWLSKAERKDTIESLRTGRLKVLVSVDILTKGFDYPAASCAILARPTKSLTVHIQQCGRVLRTAEGKQDAIILDHGGNFSNLQMLDDPLPDYLDDGKKSWHEKRKEKEDEPLPKACPACGYIKPPKVHVCPSCGFAPERKRHGVETVEGRLAEIKQSKKKASMGDKQDVYAMLLWIARNRGRKKGWIGHTYRKMFGVWPTRMDGVRATPPSAEVEQFVRDVNAQYRKSISKHAPQERQPTTGW